MGGFYTRAGEVLQRNFKRLLKALRVQFGSIKMYEARLPMNTTAHLVNLEKKYPVADVQLLNEAVSIVEPAVAPLTIAEETMSLTADVLDLKDDNSFNPLVKDYHIDLSDTSVIKAETSLITNVLGLNTGASFKPKVYQANIVFSDSNISIRRMLPVGTMAKVNASLDFAFKQPLKRYATPLKNLSTEEKISFWRQVLTALKKPSSDLKLVGIFTNVPRHGIERTNVEPGSGILRIWIKPGIKKPIPSATLLVARDIKENKIYQVFAR